jgi:hypothetical protein
MTFDRRTLNNCDVVWIVRGKMGYLLFGVQYGGKKEMCFAL